MQTLTLAAILLLLSSFAFRLGRRRAFAVSAHEPRSLHSLPGYYGSWVALWCGLPAFAVLVAWLALEPTVVRELVIMDLPAAMQALMANQQGGVLGVSVTPPKAIRPPIPTSPSPPNITTICARSALPPSPRCR